MVVFFCCCFLGFFFVFFFSDNGGESLELVAKRCGGCPVPGDGQGQAVWGSEHLMDLWVSLLITGN